MTEPYQRVGRGGAGNFYSAKDVDDVSKAVASDLEAQKPTKTSTPKTETVSSPPPEYLHTGRGGAGNWVKPTELSSHGFAQEHDTSPAATSTSTTNLQSLSNNTPITRTIGGSKPAYRGGRGGAGNYVDAEAEERERKEKEEIVRKEVEERAKRDVELGLARPERSYGGSGAIGGGVWEMGDMK